MAKLILSGYSDDNIELDGDFVEEYLCYEGLRLTFAEGFSIVGFYNRNGFWKFHPENLTVLVVETVFEANDEERDGESRSEEYDRFGPSYSDIFVLEGAFTPEPVATEEIPRSEIQANPELQALWDWDLPEA